MQYIVHHYAICTFHPTPFQMRTGRPKTKTAVMTLRVDPRVKSAAEQAAEHDHRSLTSLVEVLIINHCKTININPFKQADPSDDHEKT